MNRFYIFILRAILGAVFAVILSRIFFADANPVFMVVLALFMIIAAYISEYLRQRKSK